MYTIKLSVKSLKVFGSLASIHAGISPSDLVIFEILLRMSGFGRDVLVFKMGPRFTILLRKLNVSLKLRIFPLLQKKRQITKLEFPVWQINVNLILQLDWNKQPQGSFLFNIEQPFVLIRICFRIEEMACFNYIYA